MRGMVKEGGEEGRKRPSGASAPRCWPFRRLVADAHDAKHVCDNYTPWRRLRHACRSVDGSRIDDDAERLNLISGLTGRELPTTSTVITAATETLKISSGGGRTIGYRQKMSPSLLSSARFLWRLGLHSTAVLLCPVP